MLHDDKKVFEVEVEGLGKLQLFVDKEQACAWATLGPQDDFDIGGWVAVRRKNGKVEYIAVNTVPPSCF